MSNIETKPRYEILDGLRGVAALCVVFYHLMECYPVEVAGAIMNHGYMAVDFFFALSGFVLGLASMKQRYALSQVGLQRKTMWKS